MSRIAGYVSMLVVALVVALFAAPVAAATPAAGAIAPNAQPAGGCMIPLKVSQGGMPGQVVDCTTVRVAGNGTQAAAFPAGSVASVSLAGRNWLSSDVVGSCNGCDTMFGSGSAYRAFIRMQDPEGGDYISVGLVHDSAPLPDGDDATGLTVMIETGRKTASGYDVATSYISASQNRIPNGRASIRLSWTENGVNVSLDGFVPPRENAPRTLEIGTYAVTLTHPVATFGATANAGGKVDTTFSAITTG